MSNFQHHAKRRMGSNVSNAAYKATQRFAFGWTDPRTVFGAQKGLTVTIDLADFSLSEAYTLQMHLSGKTVNLSVERTDAAAVERLSLRELESLWNAAFLGSAVSFERMVDNSFMRGVFLRLSRAGRIQVGANTEAFTLKESNADSPEQSAVAAG